MEAHVQHTGSYSYIQVLALCPYASSYTSLHLNVHQSKTTLGPLNIAPYDREVLVPVLGDDYHILDLEPADALVPCG
ncbi:hypothetical protein PENSPDRAFT_655530 [Peniophora sp. CONT]|nr:hypothetical protein PENSPDRAFT_655530 [Peniophora sp. CONT]